MFFDLHLTLPSRLPDPVGSVPSFNMRTHAPPGISLYKNVPMHLQIQTGTKSDCDISLDPLASPAVSFESSIFIPRSTPRYSSEAPQFFFNVDLFTTTKQNNDTTQHVLGQRSVEILEATFTYVAKCFPQDRNLDTGFIGIGQCSGLRTLYNSNVDPIITSTSYTLEEGISDTGVSIPSHHASFLTNCQEGCMPLSKSSDCTLSPPLLAQ